MKFGFKISLLLNLVLVAGLGAMGYTFLVKGQVEPHADGRSAILLSPDERNLVLEEMRAFLEGVQAITEAAVEGDMDTVSERARAMGMAAAGGVPAQTMAKLPLEFKTLGMSTHQAFDDLALAASVSEEPMDVMDDVATLMYNCTSCHSTFRLGIEGSDTGE